MMSKNTIRVLGIVLAFSLVFGMLTGCNNGKAKKQTAQEVYNLLVAASEQAEQFGSDTYTAWNNGINDASDSGYNLTKLAKELNLTVSDLELGMAYALNDSDWATMTDSEKQAKKETANTMFILLLALSDSKFSTCVNVVTAAYKATGKADEIKENLDKAREKLKDLSDKYPDYDVCTKLKTLYTKIQTYYDYCMNPTGSFKELQNTIQTFRQDVRSAKNELSFDMD